MSEPQPTLAQTNALTQLESGVWVKSDEADRSFIDYTDGSSTEQAVLAQIEAAQDRSVYSEALDQNWTDWALEYHLGSKRSNIYRGLNLKDVKTVLEVGCGCGAITRYLGEQGFIVDAIEGTMARAEIASLRTAELENVQIISSNYHELVLPKKHYDLIVFTGVLEYSGAYAPPGVSPEEQLKITLARAQKALSPSGKILVAIENRTGFKYLAGASEDHLNVPNVGLLGYPEPKSRALTRGIRTWSKRQWRKMLEEIGFAAFEFCYPFPDYKIPEAILSENFLTKFQHPEQVLGSIGSRDYYAMWQPRLDEALFWRTAAATGSMGEYANSFLIVIAHQDAAVKQALDFDFVRFASVRRKRAYRLQVEKKQSEGHVRRTALVEKGSAKTGAVSQLIVESEAYIDGQTLDQLWHDALLVEASCEEIAAHISMYAKWLETRLHENAQAYVDALPQNIIVDDEGDWHLIDQEWQLEEGVTPPTILSRALFYFAHRARNTLADLPWQVAGRSNDLAGGDKAFPLIRTVEDFVRWGMAQAGLDYDANRDAFLKFETDLQEQVLRPEFSQAPVTMLEAPLHQWHPWALYGNEPQSMRVNAFWTQVDGVWHIDHSVSADVDFNQGLSVRLELPAMIATHRFLRIDPAAELLHLFQGGLRLKKLAISASQKEEEIFSISSTAQLLKQAKLRGVRSLNDEAMMLTSDDARIVLDLQGVTWPVLSDTPAPFVLDFELECVDQVDRVAAGTIFREEMLRAAHGLRSRQNMLDRQAERIQSATETLRNLESEIAEQTVRQASNLGGLKGRIRRLLGGGS